MVLESPEIGDDAVVNSGEGCLMNISTQVPRTECRSVPRQVCNPVHPVVIFIIFIIILLSLESPVIISSCVTCDHEKNMIITKMSVEF